MKVIIFTGTVLLR